MDLPEIRTIVAQFLNHSDLVTAARVCRSWNASFVTSLYSEFNWSSNLKPPSSENIITYAAHIRRLYLRMDRFELLAEHCTKLEILDISFKSQDPKDWNHLSKFVQRNPRIKSISIHEKSLEPPKAFLEALSACSGLRRLNIRMHNLDEIQMELILDTAIRLENLRITCSEIPLPKSLDKWSCFPVMKELVMYDTKGLIPLEIFRKCPNLRTLTWRTFEDTSHSVFDLCDLLKIHCPFVENLTLSSELTDMDLSLILGSCREVTSLSVYYSMFGEQAFQSLNRLFPNIRELDLKECRELTSAMAQQIMTSFPNLIQFSGVSLDARDLLGIVKDETTKEEKMVTQDWVCTHIQALAIFINGLEGKPEDWHRRILQQIAKLKKLQSLTLSPDAAYFIHHSAYDGLNFSLRIGLDSLSSLKQLTALNISGLRQEMEEQDVRWMLEAWPKLSSVIGMLHPNKERWEELCQILRERKVSSYVYSISENATDIESGEDTEEEEEEEEEEEVNEE